MAEKVPGWLERVLLPQVSELKGELKAISARLDAITARLDGEFKTVHSEIRRLDERIDGLDKRMDVVQRLAVVEGKNSLTNHGCQGGKERVG